MERPAGAAEDTAWRALTAHGHGLAVASKVMKSGETAGHGNGRLDVQTVRKRKRAGPKLEAGP